MRGLIEGLGKNRAVLSRVVPLYLEHRLVRLRLLGVVIPLILVSGIRVERVSLYDYAEYVQAFCNIYS